MEQILYIGISQSFVAGLLIATRKPRIMANQVLAAWFFLISIEMIIVLVNTNLVELYAIKVLPFTYGPLMYLYAKLMTTENPKFNYRYLWHFAPFVVFFIVSMVFLNEPVMDGSKGFLVVDRFISLRIIYGASFFISITAYSIATFVVIHRHQTNMKRLVSFSSDKFTLWWLIGLSVTFYISYVLVFIFGMIDILINFMPFDPYELSFIGLTLFAFLYGFYGYNQPSIFREILPLREIVPRKEFVPDEPREEIKYVRSGLKGEDVEQIRQRVLNYMEEEMPFLDRELTIVDVARDLRIPRHFITEVINQHMGKNFYYLINEYRVEEAKRRLADPKCKDFTILAIAYDAGFNSKSAFNTIFKEFTGMTPSQYLDSVSK